jgi:hypothetical protein
MPPKVPPTLPPIDPTVLEKADPWVKLLFDRFEHLGKSNSDRFDRVDESLDDYKSKVEKVIEQQVKTTEEVEQIQTDLDELRTDVGDTKGKIEKLQGDFSAYKQEMENKLLELKAAFDAKASSASLLVPSLTVAQQSSVESKFHALLSEAKALQTIFVIGKIPNERQSVSLSTLIQRHFQVHEAKVLPVLGKAKTRRFSVPVEKVDGVKNTIRHYNLAIRDLGWWVTQDAPPALRRMNSNAYAFFKFARDRFSPLRNFHFEVEAGYVSVSDTPLLPVYLIPTKQQKWVLLAPLLTELVANYLGKDWLETAASAFSVPDDFVTRWCSVLSSEATQATVDLVVGSQVEPPDDRMDEDFNTFNDNDSHAGTGDGGG